MRYQAISISKYPDVIARFGITLIIMTLANLVYAQFPSSRDDDFNQGVRRPGEIRFDRDTSQQAIEEVQDTFGIFYFFIDNPDQIFPWQDTTLLELHQYDPTKKGQPTYSTLGNFGSAHQFLTYQPSTRQGFDVGYHQYDAYYIQPEQLQFNLIAFPFSQVAYSRGATQSDGFFKGKFSRNFSDGFRYTIQAQTIRQLGVARQYPRQRLEQAAVGTGLWWDAPSGNYDGFLYFTSNSTQTEENGGVITPPVVSDGAIGGVSPQTATVFLPDRASTRHAHKTVGYLQQLKLFQNDSIPKEGERNFTATHKIELQFNSYKFSDNFDVTSENARRAYYGDLLTDSRGIRVFIRHNMLQNTFQLSTFRKATQQKDEIATEKDRIQVGLTHKIHFVEQDGLDTVLNNLLLTGRIDFRLKNRIQLNTYGHLDFLDNRGDFRLRGDLLLNVGKIGQLSATFINQAYQPSLVQDQFYVAQRSVWNNSFKKTFETSLQGNLSLPSLKLTISGSNHLISNYIYFDTDAKPKQLDDLLNVVQISIQHQLKVGIIHFHNILTSQATNQAVFRTPNWFTKHSLFIESKLFKKVLEFQIGIDLRMNQNYLANYYQPLIGQFQLQENQEIAVYPMLDAFLNLKVNDLRFFLKTESLVNIFQPEKLYYEVAQYPYPLYYLRFGLDWRFVN